MTNIKRLPRAACLGAGLIEIMVAVLVFSIGLIGLVRLQVGAMRNAESAYVGNQAALLAYAVLDAMRADRLAAIAGNYNLSKTCTTSSGRSGLPGHALDGWLATIKNTLGNDSGTCGEVACTGTACRVRVYWDDSRATNGTSAASVEVRTRL